MSSSKSFKNWLKGKKASDFPKVNLKADHYPAKIAIPETPKLAISLTEIPPAGFYTIDGDKLTTVTTIRRSSAPAHEIAKLMIKVVEKHGRTHYGARGQYFRRSWRTNGQMEITAGCIMGAIILEMDGGQQIAERVCNSQLNTASWGGLISAGMIPAKYVTGPRDGLHAVHVAQQANDMSLPWGRIVDRYCAEVGYHAPQKVAA